MNVRALLAVLHMYVPHDVRHVEFRGLMGSQRTPRFWGVTEGGARDEVVVLNNGFWIN